jgi:carbon-monoxide dehydrogenase large subunit
MTTTVETPYERPIGYGRLLRKEDPRFIRGKGNYVDDINLPGMLYGAILRSPYAHARIKSIDVAAQGQGRHHRQGPRAPEAGVDADSLG